MNPLLFDIRTILGMLVLGNLASALLLFIYKKKLGGGRAFGFFLTSKALQMLAYILLGMRGEISLFLSRSIGNVALVTGIALELLALTTARRESRRWEAAYALLAGVGLAVFFTAAQASNTRVGVISLVRLILFATAGTAILADSAGSPIRRTTAILCLAFCAPASLRAYLAFRAPSSFTLLDTGWANVAMYTASCFILFINGIAFLLMRLEVDSERLRESEEHLASALQFQQNLIEQIPIPVFYKDRDRVYIGCNRSFEEYMGLDRDRILGRTVYEIAPSEQARTYEAQDLEILRQPGRQVYEFEVTRGEAKRRVVFHKATFPQPDGQVGGIIGAILDVTELRLNENRLREALARNEEAMASLQDAMQNVKTLSGLLPICAWCKNIRDDTGYWQQIEAYVARHSEASFSHGICPRCAARLSRDGAQPREET